MGTNALYAFVNLFRLERLFLTGFTFYGAAGSGTGSHWQDERKSRGAFHDLEPEARIFASILARFPGEVAATPEVEELRRRFGDDAERGGDARAAAGAPLRTGRLAAHPVGHAAAAAPRRATAGGSPPRATASAGASARPRARERLLEPRLRGSGGGRTRDPALGRVERADASAEPR